ncbi:MAG: hypothetical protein P8L20_11845 [Flavobacteriales bacterium]|nr:hypothetical protein [Flavobacteriales bacterium]
MKKLLSTIVFPLMILTSALNSCGIGEQTKAAESVAEKFYKNLSEKDYDKAMSLIDEESFEISTKEEWLAVITNKESSGKFLGYKKDIGFNIKTKNRITKVKLDYICNYEHHTLYERLIMVKRGEFYKIMSYEYNTDKDKLTE